MSFFDLFKLPVKYALRTASNKKYRKDEAQAKINAKKRTGAKIARGKEKGYWVNGKETYKREFEKEICKAQDRKQARDKTIDEL